MKEFYELCRAHTDLDESEMDHLGQLAAALATTANLTQTDVFLDYIPGDGGPGLVLAQAKPEGGASLYEDDVTGQPVLPVLEPAVFHAAQQGGLVRDLKAITQEGRAVRQDALAIVGPKGRITGVLIREKDISHTLSMERKYEQLASLHARKGVLLEPMAGEAPQDLLARREIHHRVKNNLQMVASILSIQSRKSQDPAVRRVFSENQRRVLNIAGIHDILTTTNALERVGLHGMLKRIVAKAAAGEDEPALIAITFLGQDLQVGADCATSVALVVSELLANALEHAFAPGQPGTVTITTQAGPIYGGVTVHDDGRGFYPEQVAPDSLGLSIVKMMVHDKLGGQLRILSSEEGTTISFDFKIQ